MKDERTLWLVGTFESLNEAIAFMDCMVPWPGNDAQELSDLYWHIKQAYAILQGMLERKNALPEWSGKRKPDLKIVAVPATRSEEDMPF